MSTISSAILLINTTRPENFFLGGFKSHVQLISRNGITEIKFLFVSFLALVICISQEFIHLKFTDISSVAQSRPTLCNPVDYSMPGFPVHHQLPELKLMAISSVMPSAINFITDINFVYCILLAFFKI